MGVIDVSTHKNERRGNPPFQFRLDPELRELMEKNIAFKAEAAKLLNQAETDAYAPLKTQINEAAKQIGKEKGFAFIINTDNNATPYLSEEMGEDITAVLEEKLK